MSESLTLTLSGKSSNLEARYFPPIELSSNKSYVLGLVEFLAFNTIPNIDVGYNKFYIGNKVLTIPTGSYEIENINDYITEQLQGTDIIFSLAGNYTTLQCEITTNHNIDFTKSDSIGRILGFSPRILERSNKTYKSDLLVSITNVNALRIECNITTGAYFNNHKVHTIHEFFPSADPGNKIIEVPSPVIYLPVNVKVIDFIQLQIVNQDGDMVNFQEEVITIRLHIKALS